MGEILKKKLWTERCQHNKFVVDPTLNTVECGICGEALNPMWVIEQFCNKEHRLRAAIEELEEVAEKAKGRNRCKCEHCQKMTRIVKER